MHPRLFTVPAFELFGRMVGPLAMPTYGILLVLGMLAGLWIVTRQARKGLGEATIPSRATSPRWFGDWKNTTERP